MAKLGIRWLSREMGGEVGRWVNKFLSFFILIASMPKVFTIFLLTLRGDKIGRWVATG
jgi:hypothetical protein